MRRWRQWPFRRKHWRGPIVPLQQNWVIGFLSCAATVLELLLIAAPTPSSMFSQAVVSTVLVRLPDAAVLLVHIWNHALGHLVQLASSPSHGQLSRCPTLLPSEGGRFLATCPFQRLSSPTVGTSAIMAANQQQSTSVTDCPVSLQLLAKNLGTSARPPSPLPPPLLPSLPVTRDQGKGALLYVETVRHLGALNPLHRDALLSTSPAPHISTPTYQAPATESCLQANAHHGLR